MKGKQFEKRKDNEIVMIHQSKLKPFEEQPYKVLFDQSMEELIASIKENGILTPIIVRRINDEQFEIISGHRRVAAGRAAKIHKFPAQVVELNDDEAAILLVDSNLQRENILPSEKAFAYKLKLDAMKRQGMRTDLTLSQDGTKLRSDTQLAEQVGESRNTRPLMYPEEILQMDNKECLLLIRGQKPLKAYKVIPNEMSSYKELKYTRVADYIPEWHETDKENEKKNTYKGYQQTFDDMNSSSEENNVKEQSEKYESVTPNFGSDIKSDIKTEEKVKGDEREIRIEMDYSNAVLHDESKITQTTADDILNE